MKKLILFLLFIPLLSIPLSCTEQEPFMYPETEPKMPETYSKICLTTQSGKINRAFIISFLFRY